MRLASVVLFVVVGCSPVAPSLDDGGSVDAAVAPGADAGLVDAGVMGVGDAGLVDAGVVDGGLADAGLIDAGLIDAGLIDAGLIDAGLIDAGLIDAGPIDAGLIDAGLIDAGPIDAGLIDAGLIDAGLIDAGLIDAGLDSGTLDAGTRDAGRLDAGAPDGGPEVPLGNVVFTRLALADGGQIDVGLPRTGVLPSEVAVIVNVRDPQSVAVANDYLTRRALSPTQRIDVSFDPAVGLTPAMVNQLKAQIDADAGFAQALAITWTQPWQVNGMSLTSALTFGFDAGFSSITICSATATSPLFGTTTTRPFTDLGVRPAMMLAGDDAGVVATLVARSVAAESTFPRGTGHFIRTTDNARSLARGANFSSTAGYWNHDGGVAMQFHLATGASTNALSNTSDVLFYLTGLTSVPLQSVSFVPGALADHFTSYGGILRGSSQMSSLRWLEAGASASYGTVREPCAYQAKFPLASQLVARYLRGATALEAYWSSVEWPDEGVFIGDPLTAPFRPKAALGPAGLRLSLPPGMPEHRYAIYRGPSTAGPWQVERSWVSTGAELEIFEVPLANAIVVVDLGVPPRPGLVRSELADRSPVWLHGRRLLTRDQAGNLYLEELERSAPRLFAPVRRLTRPRTARVDDDGVSVLSGDVVGLGGATVAIEAFPARALSTRALPEPPLPDGGASRTDTWVFGAAGDRIGWQNDSSGQPVLHVGRIDGGVEVLGTGAELVLTPRSTVFSSVRGVERVDALTGQRTVIIAPTASRANVSAGRNVVVAERTWGTEVVARTPGEIGAIFWHGPQGTTPLSFGGHSAGPAFTPSGPAWVEQFDSAQFQLVRRTPAGLERVARGITSSSVFHAPLGTDELWVVPFNMTTVMLSTRALEPAFFEACPDSWFAAPGETMGCHLRVSHGAVLGPVLAAGFTAQRPGDVTGDGVVDQADVDALTMALGRRRGEPGFDPRLDLDDDHEISLADLAQRARDLAAGAPVGFGVLTATAMRQTLEVSATRFGDRAAVTIAFSPEPAPTFAAGLRPALPVGQPYVTFVRVNDPHDVPTVRGSVSAPGASVSAGPLGDVNGDGVSNSLDLSHFRTRLNSVRGSANYSARFDLDEDGDIDAADVSLLGREGSQPVAVLSWTPPSTGASATFELSAWDRRTPVVSTTVTLHAQ